MNTERMTVHKALAELKILDNRIEDAINDVKYVSIKKASATKIDGVVVSDWEKRIESAYTKATDLIKRRNALKRAVVLSNAVTKVSIDGKEYTVAEAIEMKNHGIEFDVILMNKLTRDYNECQLMLHSNNEIELESRADKFISSMYSGKDKVESAEVKKAREDFIKANTYELCDPLNSKEIIESLDNRVSKFNAEVDAALSVSNAITEITIEY